MSMITEEFGVIPPDIQTQMLIAPVMGEMIATRAFAIGEQFIVNSTLYKATKAIAIGDTISVGTGANDNCILSDTIAQQIKEVLITEDISSEFTVNSTYVTQFQAYKSGKIIFCMAAINPSTPNITKLVDVPSKYDPPAGFLLWPVGGTPNANVPALTFRFANNNGNTSLYYFGQPITSAQDIRVWFSYPLA